MNVKNNFISLFICETCKKVNEVYLGDLKKLLSNIHDCCVSLSFKVRNNIYIFLKIVINNLHDKKMSLEVVSYVSLHRHLYFPTLLSNMDLNKENYPPSLLFLFRFLSG